MSLNHKSRWYKPQRPEPITESWCVLYCRWIDAKEFFKRLDRKYPRHLDR